MSGVLTMMNETGVWRKLQPPLGCKAIFENRSTLVATKNASVENENLSAD
jgi:hypothetical protein